mmetsp:Transcript_4081/g.11825  ORF Transcript_4081/g.11825 Transcript_4081/m.11825 type:complete len:347 (-) Transcript_4081:91-1131(-)|eukprot:CAMPEP_0176042900 /NCGR_PEP_ID=MMETSP0120_2-20121206/21287_1 /TAXON_ID=160619 /ORGANISM="Kryptoperidinium foliaceum, Strain CCMP 1326" /LENGTH=346 /DNA_ID=CAMNT_0017376307 /DNA_START=334 /DNA_END=1374 /DNA_ORIENTATION=-
MATLTSPSSAFSAVKVNVKLCGSVPRQELESLSLSRAAVLASRSPNTNSCLVERDGNLPCPVQEDDTMCLASQLFTQLSNVEEKTNPRSGPLRPSAPEFEAPNWAVPAPGESRLEPISYTADRQSAVNLRAQAVFRVGRSPQADIQLFHDNSSRKHAMLFHHSNGSCYLVDCGSAHGTFVNGVRVHSPPNGGVVIPYKVRRGSIIRFGGPGAPQFMLKSFTFDLDELREPPIINTHLSPTSSMGAVVEHNTRLNALGKAAKDTLFTGLTSKRSFDSVETVDSDIENKRMRCSSPPLSPERQLVRLVSPESSQPNKRRRVSFSSDPPKAFYPNLISPDLSSDENEEL